MNLMGLREKGGSEAYLFAPRGIYDFFRGSMSLRGFKQKAILPVASTFKGGREDLVWFFASVLIRAGGRTL